MQKRPLLEVLGSINENARPRMRLPPVPRTRAFHFSLPDVVDGHHKTRFQWQMGVMLTTNPQPSPQALYSIEVTNHPLRAFFHGFAPIPSPNCLSHFLKMDLLREGTPVIVRTTAGAVKALLMKISQSMNSKEPHDKMREGAICIIIVIGYGSHNERFPNHMCFFFENYILVVQVECRTSNRPPLRSEVTA